MISDINNKLNKTIRRLDYRFVVHPEISNVAAVFRSGGTTVSNSRIITATTYAEGVTYLRSCGIEVGEERNA